MKKLSKAFILLQFGKPHEWTQKFIDNATSSYGFDFLIITPNKFKSTNNVKIIPMTVEEFNELCFLKLGIKPKLFITKKGIPNFHVTDLMTAFGLIFEDYLKSYDFWGLIGLDNVIGRIDHFVSDKILKDTDIYSDDLNTFNGNFSLLRNNDKINKLFMLVAGWQDAFLQRSCKGCVGKGKHLLFGTDEYLMTNLLRTLPEIRFKYPKYFIHGHDRLELHKPKIKLKLEQDGSLYEIIDDVNPPDWEHAHNNFGHEIAYFHFSQTKKWPTLKK